MDNSQFMGKICPYCRTEFKEDDEIVVCSECDMPHHKECWIENQGCTTFGCLGTIQNPTPNMPLQSNVVFCTRCGHQNFSNNTFCTLCGHKLFVPIQLAPAQQFSPLSQPQIAFPQQSAVFSQQPQPAIEQNTLNTQPIGIFQQPTFYQQQSTQNPIQGACVNPQLALSQQAIVNSQQGTFFHPSNSVFAGQQAANLFQPQYVNTNHQQSVSNADPYKNSYMQYKAHINQQFFTMSPDSYAVELAFIQDNTDYYIPKFNSMRTEGKKVKWNWAAFFLSYYWMFYRKMYLLGSAVLTVSVIFSLIKPAAFYLSLAVAVFMGLMGNYLYKYHVEQETAKIKDIPHMQRSNYLNKKGGTNIALPLIILGVILFIAILVNI